MFLREGCGGRVASRKGWNPKQPDPASGGTPYKAGAATTAPTLGFSAKGTLTHSTDQQQQSSSQGQWNGTELNGDTVTLMGDSFTGKGVTSNSNNLNLQLNRLTLEAGTNSYSSTSQNSSSSQSASMSTTGSASASASKQDSSSSSSGVDYTNSRLNTGNVQGNLEQMTLNGGRINADTGTLITRNLEVRTVQNSSSSQTQSKGINVGIGGGSAGVTGGNVGFNKGNGSGSSLMATEQSGIVFADATGNNHQLTVLEHTSNVGGVIANTQGKTNFTTNSITTQDLQNYDRNEQRGFGLSAGVNNNPTADTMSMGTVGVQASHSGHILESTTRATVGEGAVVTSDANALSNVNRDINTATVTTKNQAIGGLKVDASIDSRVFSEKGRDDIIDEQKELGRNVQTVGDITGDAVSKGVSVTANTVVSNTETANKVIKKIEGVLGAIGVPVAGNYGGLYSEIPILLGADDIHQKPYLIVGAESDKFKANPSAFMLVEELPGFNDLPKQSKDQVKGMYISKESVIIDGSTVTYQNFTNGMLNTKEQALVNGLQQTYGANLNENINKPAEFTLNFNNSKGLISDGLEALVDKMAGFDINGMRPLSWFNTGASDAAGQTVANVINSTDKANFAQHSQGNLLVNSAIPEINIDKTASQMQNESGTFNFTFNAYGSPVQNTDFQNVLQRNHMQLYSSTSNTGDPISELLGGNTGLYNAALQPNINSTVKGIYNPLRLFNAINLPSFLKEKYDTKLDEVGNPIAAQSVSPHSSYSCSGKCVTDGSNQPSIDQVNTSINSAQDANLSLKDRKRIIEKSVNKTHNQAQEKKK